MTKAIALVISVVVAIFVVGTSVVEISVVATFVGEAVVEDFYFEVGKGDREAWEMFSFCFRHISDPVSSALHGF